MMYDRLELADNGDVEVVVFVPSVDGRALPPELLLPVQTHSVNVEIADSKGEFPETDGLITRRCALMLGVRTADCVPIVMWAPDIEAVAAVHAGWRGTLGKIPAVALEKLKGLGADAALVKVWFGPSICCDCYEVSPELAADFTRKGFGAAVVSPADGSRPHLNLQNANCATLLGAGVQESNISRCNLCTFHTQSPRFPSYRRCPGTPDRIITAIRLKNGCLKPSQF